MIKLYLHIGTEKTGSSFIQSYLANNRRMMLKHGIFFPTAGKREADMKAGRISPGNASILNDLLENSKWDKADKWLKRIYIEAEHQNCDKVLLSNEIFIKTFSKKSILEKFIIICKTADFRLQDLFLIVREPVSQAMSLYKHRSKRGDMMPIQEWLETNYTLAESLDSFYNILKGLPLGLCQYPYQKKSQYLINICVNEWLGLDENVKPENGEVNPSLTLSELILLSKIKKKDSILAKLFYDNMISLETNHKSDDVYIKKYVSNVINNFMIRYNDLWLVVNSNMRIPTKAFQYSEIKIESKNITVSFSETQIELIGEFISNRLSLKTLILKNKLLLKKTILQALKSLNRNF